MKIIFGVFLLSINWICLFGQAYSNRVVDLFEKNERGIWVRQYEGLSNELNPTALILGHTDKLYRGLFIEKGLPEYRVEGEVNGSKLHLLVLNKNENVVGYIQGSVVDSHLVAEWDFVDRDVVKSLNLDRVLRISHDVNCGKNKSLTTFEGSFLKDNAEMFLQREEEGEMYGIIHLDKKNTSYVLKGKCEDFECKQSQFIISQHKGTFIEWMKWKEVEPTFFHATLKDNTVFHFEMKKSYPMVCGSQIIQDIQLSYVFPEIDNQAFNIWLKTEVNYWLKSFEKVKIPKGLNLQEYQFWVDLDFLGEKIVSGIINANYANTELKRKAFVYDLNKKDPYAFEEWINKKEELSAFLKKAIDGEKKRDILKEDENSKTWYASQNFDIMTIRKEGLCLHSNFSRVHGERSMIVPWELIEGFIKKPSKVRKKLN